MRDPRRPFGWQPQHPPLPLVARLLLSVVAMRCGANSHRAMAQWGRERREDQPDLLEALGFPPGQCPATVTLHRLFRQLDVVQFEQILGQWLTRTGVTPQEPVAIDGQTLRAVAASAVPGRHLVRVDAHASAAVVAQIMVSNKGQEQSALDRLLTQIPLAGRLVTFDALHTHRDVCQVLDEAGARFVAPVRANQPTLLTEIQEIFAPWPLETGDPPAWLQAEVQQAGGAWQSLTRAPLKPCHGRWEWRRIGVWTDARWATSLGLSSDQGQPWPMVRQLICVERRRTHLRHHRVIKATQEIVYCLRNQPAPAARTLSEIRRHWQIENGLHRQRDVRFDQDRSTVRVGGAAHLFAALRNLALTIVHRHQLPTAAAARRTWAGRPHLAVALVLAL